MAVAMLQEWAPSDDRTTTNYDSIGKKIGSRRDPPAGLVIHAAGFSDDGTFRIFEVWESRGTRAVRTGAADADRPGDDGDRRGGAPGQGGTSTSMR